MLRPSSLVGFCLALMCAFLVTGCKKKSDAPQKRQAASPYVVEVVTIKGRPFRGTLSATGTLRAQESVNLQAERAGIVTKINFEEGKPVKSGQVLITTDDSELQAQLARNQAQLELVTATEKRSGELLKSQALSQAEYDQSLANLHIAQAEVDLIKAQIAKTRIVAPFDGIAGLRQVSPGAYLTVGRTVASLQDIRTLKLDFTLPERYLEAIRQAQTISIRVAGRTEPLSGKIDAIEPAIMESTRSLMVRALVPNEEQALLPGGFAEVEVALQEIPNAILIPAIALIPGLKEQKVFLNRNGEVDERTVRIGRRTADSVQIESGLKDGDQLIITGILQLRPKMKVQIRQVADEALTASNAVPANAVETKQGAGK